MHCSFDHEMYITSMIVWRIVYPKKYTHYLVLHCFVWLHIRSHGLRNVWTVRIVISTYIPETSGCIIMSHWSMRTIMYWTTRQNATYTRTHTYTYCECVRNFSWNYCFFLYIYIWIWTSMSLRTCVMRKSVHVQWIYFARTMLRNPNR